MKLDSVSVKFTDKVKESHKAAVLSYVENLTAKGFPAILSVEHFSVLINVKSEALYEMSNGTTHFYRSFEIVKENGGRRKIDAPLPSLHFVQRWILDNILSRIELHSAAKAYRVGYSIKDNARFHRAQPLILKTDVKNFFGSITEHYIVNVFRALGYSKKVSIFFGKICCLNGSLPQGAATSGYLSNIYLTKLDAVIFEFCKNEKVRYTRYADDMTFSGQSFDTDMYLKLVAKELAKLKLNLNHQKSRILKPHNRQIVTGLVVNKNVSVPRDYLRGLRQDCYYITKFGIYGHCRKVALKDPRVLLETVIGRLAYAVQYQVKDPKWGILHSEMMDVRRETFGY